jgi:hypothetical protein
VISTEKTFWLRRRTVVHRLLMLQQPMSAVTRVIIIVTTNHGVIQNHPPLMDKALMIDTKLVKALAGLTCRVVYYRWTLCAMLPVTGEVLVVNTLVAVAMTGIKPSLS